MGRDNYYTPSTEEKMAEVKMEICHILRREILYSPRSQREIAWRLGTSQGNVSRVLNRRVENLTINQLFRYLAILKPDFKILVAPQ